MRQVALRDAVADDAGAIAAVHVASWRAAYRGLLPDAVLDGLSVPGRTRMWSSLLAAPTPGSAVAVAVAGPDVLGFASAGPARGAGSQGELYALYLAPEVRGCGVGRRLHAAALRHLWAHGFGSATLWVLDGNERALRFYQRAGWRDTGRTRTESSPGGVELAERELTISGAASRPHRSRRRSAR